MRPCLECSALVQVRHGHIGESPIKGLKEGKRLCLSSEERLRELELFSLAEVSGGLMNICKHLKGWYKKGSRGLFSCALWQDQRQGAKLKCRNLCLNIKKQFFTESVTEQGHRSPREVVKPSSSEIFKRHLAKLSLVGSA